jgi:hypothetical protein
MCWSANGSLSTWAVAMVLAAGSYGYEPKIWLFMVVFAQMQLVEYFLWKNLKVPSQNALWSKVAAAVVLLEAAAAIYMIENVPLRNKIFTGYALYVVILLATYPFDWRTTIGGNGHLSWQWAPSLTALIPFYLCFFGSMWIAGNYVTLAGGILTAALSIHYYGKYGSASSMWCWISIFGLFVLFLKSRS